MFNRRFPYVILGMVIAVLSLGASITYALPSLAQNPIFLPFISGETDKGIPVEASEAETKEDVRISRYGIPFLPTLPPDEAIATPTPPSPINPPRDAPEPPKPDPVESVDLSPDVSRDDKAAVYVQLPSGKRIAILVDPTEEHKAIAYISSLPEGTMLATVAPPAAAMGKVPTIPKDLPEEDIIITEDQPMIQPPLPPDYSK